MTIEDLSSLYDNPIISGKSKDFTYRLQTLLLSEIISLEANYNDGKSFSLALTELLLLAGSFCYVLDIGMNDTQEEIQETTRSLLAEYGRKIDRPFFVIDVYNVSDQFLFV